MSNKNMPPAAVADKTWHDDARALTLLYFIEEKGERFGTALDRDRQFLDDTLTQMYRRELVDIAGADPAYVVTSRGREVLKAMVAMYDQVRQFEVFAAVNIEESIPDNDRHPDDANRPHDNLYDPRFQKRADSVDMRLAMMTCLGDAMHDERGTREINPFLIVYMQQLADGQLVSSQFWFDLQAGTFFRQIEAIVDSAYRWESAAETREDAAQAMTAIYRAGMIERLKREGMQCARCETPLGVYEDIAKRNGEGPLKRCPNPGCACSFGSSPPVERADAGSDESCPRCGHEIILVDTCGGCGAVIDRSLRPGTVAEETVVWTHGYDYYGYQPVYYDPFDPFLIGACYGLVMCPILC